MKVIFAGVEGFIGSNFIHVNIEWWKSLVGET